MIPSFSSASLYKGFSGNPPCIASRVKNPRNNPNAATRNILRPRTLLPALLRQKIPRIKLKTLAATSVDASDMYHLPDGRKKKDKRSYILISKL